MAFSGNVTACISVCAYIFRAQLYVINACQWHAQGRTVCYRTTDPLPQKR
jgi:hypothetical protein